MIQLHAKEGVAVQIELNNCLNQVKTVFPSHLCQCWTPPRCWEPPVWYWTKVDMRGHSSHKNLFKFYTSWGIAEWLSASIWSHITNLSAGAVPEKSQCSFKQYLLQVSYSCYSLLDTRSKRLILAIMKLGNFCLPQGVWSTIPRRLLCWKSCNLISFWLRNLMVFLQEDGWLLSRWLSTTSFQAKCACQALAFLKQVTFQI